MANDESDKKPTVAYVPFKTFMSAIDALKPRVPVNINRTVWPSQSGVTVSQILGAFKFLGLISQTGEPASELHTLVENEGSRKTIIRKLLLHRYSPLITNDLAKMDSRTLENAMRQYQVTGATLQKAITFFLQAARFAEIPLSPYLAKKTRGPSNRKKKNPNFRLGTQEELGEPKFVNPLTGGPAKTIKLSNGGNLTLQASVDTFQMSAEDRGFVLKLLDLIENHEAHLKALAENN
jgi:Family of unknown function (DUF5343)